MATLQASDIADQVIAAQKELGRGRLTDITTDLQEHVAMSRLMTGGNVKWFNDSIGPQWQFLTEDDGNAKNTGLFGTDNLVQRDGLLQASVPWRYTTGGFTWDERQPQMASGAAQIVDFYKTKRYQSLVSIVKKMEANFWDEPSSSTDATTPFGIKYWIVYNATEGFNGANNTNFAAGPGGVSRTTYARTKNYTAQYTAVTREDLVRKIRKALWSCNFKPAPPKPPIPGYAPQAQRFGMYTTYDVVSPLEELAEDRNQNLGSDLAAKDGMVTIRRVPIEAVPYLQTNEATADPVVGIDWNMFKIAAMRKFWGRETPPLRVSGMHNVWEVHYDYQWNTMCYDARRLFLIAKSSWH